MGKADVTFDHDRKKHWRRWQWNQVAERIAVKPKEAVVLYLPGPEALDVPVAEQKGFRRDNLIGVEKDPRRVQLIRRKGLLCVQGTMLDVLKAWNPLYRLDCVLLDFACGFTDEAVKTFETACSLAYVYRTPLCVVANCLRGRTEAKWRPVVAEYAQSFVNQFALSKCLAKHRGFYLYWRLTWGVAKAFEDENDEWMSVLKRVHNSWNPEVHTYRSVGTMRYDSVALSFPMDDYARCLCECFERHGELPIDKATALSLRAVMAHRTRRIA